MNIPSITTSVVEDFCFYLHDLPRTTYLWRSDVQGAGDTEPVSVGIKLDASGFTIYCESKELAEAISTKLKQAPIVQSTYASLIEQAKISLN